MEKIEIQKIEQLDFNELANLIDQSVEEGYHFMLRLKKEYINGENRFSKDGEAFFVAKSAGNIIGVSGLNQDPYLQNPKIGRVRRLYVSKNYRRLGVGRLLIDAIIQEAQKYYIMIILKTDNPIADKFYRSRGFSATSLNEHATHFLQLFNEQNHVWKNIHL
jgi:ribosomal protein S18 acetylase RimI-like enzyme